MFIIDDLEHESEQGDRNLGALLQIKNHVEALHVGEILQQVEISLEGRILGILESSQLLDKEHEDPLDLCWILVWSFWSKDPENISDAASHQELNISAGVLEIVVISNVYGQRSVLIVTVVIILLRQSLECVGQGLESLGQLINTYLIINLEITKLILSTS